MVSVVKTMGIMTTVGALVGAGVTNYSAKKVEKFTLDQAKTIAKDGFIPIGGKKPDGTMWDGKMSVDDLEKQMKSKRRLSAAVSGIMSALGIALVSGLTLLLRGKVK